MKGGIYMVIFLWNKIKRYMVMCIMFCIFLKGIEFEAKEQLSMYAKSYALMDGATGRVLIGKNEDIAMANASTTKILTCIIALEQCDMKEMVKVSKNAATQPKVRLGLKEGNSYPLSDLLYGLMLESYNDCAVAIAEHIAGSEDEFSNMMNQKAKEIGCVDTYFLTPNGLDKEDINGYHHTTASDLCKMMAYCVWESPKRNEFLGVTQTREYQGEANGHTYSFTNKNAFLDQMSGAISGKTGYTAKAGYCYVMAYEDEGEKYCVSLLACGWPNNKNYKWSDTRTLLNYGIENYDLYKITIGEISEFIELEAYINTPNFWKLNQTECLQISSEQKQYEVLLSEGETLRKEIVLYENITLPVVENQELGVCNIYMEDLLLDQILLTATAEMKEWKMKEIIEVILCQFLTFSS